MNYTKNPTNDKLHTNDSNGTIELADHHYRMLHDESAISDAVIRGRGYYTITDSQAAVNLGFSQRTQARIISPDNPTLVIPRYHPDGRQAGPAIRPDVPRQRSNKPVKYDIIAGSGNVLDCHPSILPHLPDPSIPLALTEGSKKADALISHGVSAISLNGVYGWLTKNAYNGKVALPAFDDIALNGREIALFPDGDITENRNVAKAIKRAVEYLEYKDARPFVVFLPPAGIKKMGVDDWLALGDVTAETLRILIAHCNLFRTSIQMPKPPPKETAVGGGPYEVKDGYTYFIDATGEALKSTAVAAFNASISTETTSEYGEKSYTIEGETGQGKPFSLDIGNDDFASNGKLSAALISAAGARSPIMPRMEAHLRTAIQMLTSEDVRQVVRYDRTGWANGKFLIPGRAPENVNIHLGEKLPYDLSGKADITKGVTALKALAESMPGGILLPFIAAVFQPPLAKLTGWLNERSAFMLVGQTGSLKTTIAQTAMCIWGKGFLLDHNLIKWGEGATSNSIMNVAVSAHDMPFPIDNFKPDTGGGVRAFVSLTHNILEGGEKLRLTRNSELKKTKPIYCWPIYTGESMPDTDSATLARILVTRLAWRSGEINEKLAEAQELSHHLPAIGNAWLDWLESEPGKAAAKEAQAEFPSRRKYWAKQLKEAQENTVNIMRLATNLATNEMTYKVMKSHPTFGDMFGDFSLDYWRALGTLASTMARSTVAGSEALRFLEVLSALYASERVKLANGSDPIDKHRPEKYIGWETNDGIFIFPDMAIAAVEDLKGKEFLNHLTKNDLYAQLDEMGKVASKDEKRGKTTQNKWLGGKSARVLHLTRDCLIPSLTEEKEKPPEQSEIPHV